MNNATFQNSQIPFATGICIGNAQGVELSGISANAQGLPVSPYATYSVIPLTAQTNNVALSQSVTSAITLQLTPGTGVTLVTDPTSPFVGCLQLDCQRALQFNVAVTSGSPTAVNIVIDGYTGFDSYVRRTQEQVNTSTTVNQVFTSNKTYLYVKSITVSGGVGTGGTMSVGTADVLGLPFYLQYVQDIVAVKWLELGGSVALNGATDVLVSPSGIPTGNSLINADIKVTRTQATGTVGAFNYNTVTNTTFELTGTAGDTSTITWVVDFSKNCRFLVGDSATPSLTTGDTIGRVVLPTPSNGATPFVCTQYLRQTDILPGSQTVTGYIGLPPYNNLG